MSCEMKMNERTVFSCGITYNDFATIRVRKKLDLLNVEISQLLFFFFLTAL